RPATRQPLLLLAGGTNAMLRFLAKWSPFLVAAVALALTARPASAGGFIPPPLMPDESDALTIFRPDGTVFDRVAVLEELEDPSEIVFESDPTIIDPNQFGNATNLLHADGTFSDIFGIATINGTLFLAYNSDGDPAPPEFGGQGAINLPEGLPF